MGAEDDYDSVDAMKRKRQRGQADRLQEIRANAREKGAMEESEGNFFYASVDVPDNPERDHEDLILRRVPRTVAHRFRGAAGARALTHAQYLTALVSLHDMARRRADEGDDAMSSVLQQLGLQTVTI